MTERSEALEAAIEPVVAALDLDLYDVEVAGKGSARILRVVIDRPAGDDRGLDLEAITAATEALSPALDADADAAALLRGSYTLEVTSPGLERTLRLPRHFARAIGSTVSVKTGHGADATRRRGVLADAGADRFELELDDGGRESIAYSDVVQARTVFEWGGQDKPKSRKPPRRKKGREKVAS